MNNNWRQTDKDAYSRLGRFISERQSNQLFTQLSVFQSALVNFACEHGTEIRENAEFRNKFTQMCQSVDIDPLELLILSSSKSSNSLNDENFYIGLSVRIVEVCQQTRDLNGGLISLKELSSQLKSKESVQLVIEEKDINRSLSILNSMGKGYEILNINDKKWLKFSSASSGNISKDNKKIYELCEFMGGYVTYRLLRDNYGWDKVRFKTVIEEMIMNGFLWVDSQGVEEEWQYWEPSWISR